MSKYLILVVLFFNSPVYAIVDMAGAARDMLEASAAANALSGVIDEINVADSQDASKYSESLKMYSTELNKLNTNLSRVAGTVNDIEGLKKFPKFDSKRLSQSLSYTKRYIQRLKRVIASISYFPKAVTAYSSAENSIALNEVVRNQQELIGIQQEVVLIQRINYQFDQVEKQKWKNLSNYKRTFKKDL